MMFGEIGSYVALLEKVFGILGSLIYLIFALIIVKQVGMMSKNVKDKFNGVLKIFSYGHLAAAALLVFLAMTIL